MLIPIEIAIAEQNRILVNTRVFNRSGSLAAHDMISNDETHKPYLNHFNTLNRQTLHVVKNLARQSND